MARGAGRGPGMSAVATGTAKEAPVAAPDTFDLTYLGYGEWRAVASRPDWCSTGGDGDRLIAYIQHCDGAAGRPAADDPARPYLVDPCPPDGCVQSRRWAATLGQARSIARQMARRHFGALIARQERRPWRRSI